MDEGYKHYIRIDANNIVVYGFTNAFEEPQEGDLQLTGVNGYRHFITPLTNDRGQYIYKYDGTNIVPRTQEELDAEWSGRPPEPPSLEDRLKATEDMLLEYILGGM